MNIFKLKKIDLYIIKKFLGTYVFMIILIMSIAVVFDIQERTNDFKDASMHEIIFDYYLNFIPNYTYLFSQLFIFLSTIFFTSKLAGNSEIIAILSTGIGFKRLLKPYLISAFIITIFMFTLGNYIIPKANINYQKFDLKYIHPSANKSSDNDIQFKIQNNRVLYFGTFDIQEKKGYNFSLDKFDSLKLTSRLIAKSIKYNSKYSWTIKDYTVRKFEGLKEEVYSGEKIDTTLEITPNDFIILKDDQKIMTTPQLYRYINSQKSRGLGNIQPFEIEFHTRFAGILSAFILTIIAASLSARKMKGGMGINLGIGLLLSMSYVLFQTISNTFAVQGNTSPMVAAWIPNIIFGIIAYYFYKKAPN